MSLSVSRFRPLKKKSIILFSSFVILFHLLRNVSGFYYIILGIWVLFTGVYILSRLKKNAEVISFAIFLISYVAAMSGMAGAAEDQIIGIFRLFYLAPFVIFLFSTNFLEDQIKVFWNIIALFVVGSAISLLFQFYFGPITWFADSSERAGVERFSSLAGSLTVFGSIVGIGILVVGFCVNNFIVFSIAFVLLTAGAMLSLQKMAIANYIIAIFLLFFSKKIKLRKKFELTLILFFIFIFGIYFIINNGNLEAYTDYVTAIFSKNADNVYDVSIWESIIDRFSELPMAVVDYWGWRLLLGVGVYGGAGGLGYQDYPMAHNLLLEIIAIFGVPIGCVVIYFLWKYTIFAFRAIAQNRTPSTTLSGFVYILLTFSKLFTGALFYHPAIGLIFWFSASNIYKEFNNVQQ